jgi:imidazolonepropionase-like amidohydrolase
MRAPALLRLFLSAALCIPQAHATPQMTTDRARDIAITHVTLIDVSSGESRPDMTVIVTGNRITFVGHSRRIPVSSSREVIDARGRFLIPGLWDMHDHALSDNRAGYSFPLLIANGVTGIREMGSNIPLDDVNRIRHDVESHRILGPRFGALTYRLLDGRGTQFSQAVEVTDPDQARELVRTYKSRGADFMKPYNLLPRDVYLALVDEAGKQRIPVAGHVPFSMTVTEVSDLGQRTIEHNFDVLISASRNEDSLRAKLRTQPQVWPVIEAEAAATYDEKKARTLFAHLARNGTWSCPTIAFYRYPSLIRDDSALRLDSTMKYVPQSAKDQWHTTFERVAKLFPTAGPGELRYRMRSRIVAEMHRAGVRILAGTDAGAMYSVHGFSLHDELEAMVAAGLSPLNALRAATINPAKFLGRERDLGTIEKGKLADLVLLDANPLERITNTRKIFAVIADGRYFSREALNGLLARAEGAARESR